MIFYKTSVSIFIQSYWKRIYDMGYLYV